MNSLQQGQKKLHPSFLRASSFFCLFALSAAKIVSVSHLTVFREDIVHFFVQWQPRVAVFQLPAVQQKTFAPRPHLCVLLSALKPPPLEHTLVEGPSKANLGQQLTMRT